MKLLLGTHTSEDDNAGFDYALVDLTPEDAKVLLHKIKLVAELRAQEDLVSNVEFFCFCQANYFEAGQEAEDIQTDANRLGDGVWRADDIKEDDIEFLNSECDRIVIYANWNKAIGPTIFWRTIPKHTDIEIETDYIPLDLVKRIAGIYPADELLKYLQIVTELAEQNVIDPRTCDAENAQEEADRQQAAIDIIRDFVTAHSTDEG